MKKILPVTAVVALLATLILAIVAIWTDDQRWGYTAIPFGVLTVVTAAAAFIGGAA
jgi:hypothetical protein